MKKDTEKAAPPMRGPGCKAVLHDKPPSSPTNSMIAGRNIHTCGLEKPPCKVGRFKQAVRATILGAMRKKAVAKKPVSMRVQGFVQVYYPKD
jgi:hypothetical protein